LIYAEIAEASGQKPKTQIKRKQRDETLQQSMPALLRLLQLLQLLLAAPAPAHKCWLTRGATASWPAKKAKSEREIQTRAARAFFAAPNGRSKNASLCLLSLIDISSASV